MDMDTASGRDTSTTGRGSGPGLRRRALGSLAAVLALSACSVGLGGDPEQTTPEATADGTGDGASDNGGANPGDAENAVVDEGAAAAGVDLTDLGEPIATAEVQADVEGDDDATMTVSLYGLERQGETLVGTYSFLVHSDSREERWIYDYLGNQRWEPYLVDTQNLNRHGVLGKYPEEAMTDSQGPKFRPGQNFYAYAAFAAPAEDVGTMDVLMVGGAPLVTAVPIR